MADNKDKSESKTELLERLAKELEKNNLSNEEIEKHGRNSRRHLLESKKELITQTQELKDLTANSDQDQNIIDTDNISKSIDELSDVLKSSSSEVNKLETVIKEQPIDNISESSSSEVETEGDISPSSSVEIQQQLTTNISELGTLIGEQNQVAQDKKTDVERNQILSNLIATTKLGDKEGKENVFALQTQMFESQAKLEKAISTGDEAQIAIEKENQEKIMAGAETEENRREANKVVNKQTKLLGKISTGIGGMVGFIKDNAAVVGGSIFAAIAMLNPELMEKILKRVSEALVTAMNVLEKILQGDIFGAFEEFSKEWAIFSGALLFFFRDKIVKALKGIVKGFKFLNTAAIKYKAFLTANYGGSMIAHFKGMMSSLGGKLKKGFDFITGKFKLFRTTMLTSFIPSMWSNLKSMMSSVGGKLKKGFDFLVKAFKTFRVFMMATFIPSMIGALTGMMAAITPVIAAIGAAIAPILVIAAPFIAIAAGIGLVIYALKKSFDEVFAVFNETGSIFEAFKAAIITFPATIIGLPLDLLRKGLAWIMGLFGFDNAKATLESFSFTDLFKNMFGKVFDVLVSSFDWIADKFKLLGNFIKAIGLGTVAAVKAAFPGGESPTEAFSRVYNQALNSGNADTGGGGEVKGPAEEEYVSRKKAFEKEIFIDEKSDEANQLSIKELDDVRFKAATSEDDDALMLAKMDSTDGANRFDTKEGRAELRKTLGAESKDDLLKFKEAGETDYASDNQRVNSMVADKLLEFQKDFQKPKDTKELSTIEKIAEKITPTTGDELDTVSVNNMTAAMTAQSAAPVVVTNNVDNSNNSKSSKSVITSTGRKRGFGLSTDIAYA